MCVCVCMCTHTHTYIYVYCGNLVTSDSAKDEGNEIQHLSVEKDAGNLKNKVQKQLHKIAINIC